MKKVNSNIGDNGNNHRKRKKSMIKIIGLIIM